MLLASCSLERGVWFARESERLDNCIPYGLGRFLFTSEQGDRVLRTPLPERTLFLISPGVTRTMAATGDDVLKKIADNEVKFVDLRFTDTRGKEQHVSVPSSMFDAAKFTEGHALEGSANAGWKGIGGSEMMI